MKIHSNWILVMCLFLNFSANAAIPKKLQTEQNNTPTVLAEDKEPILAALRLPFENRIDALKAQGAKTAATLEAMAFDRHETLATRWKSLTALARVQGEKCLPAMEKALSSNEWFMRNAAMIAVQAVSKEKGVEWAKKLIQDESLVVRTAAVETLNTVPSEDVKETLWRELYSERNYRNGKSLWIRRHIARSLSRQAKGSETKKFAKMLRDEDTRLHPWAVLGLERSTGKVLGEPQMNWTDKRERWLSFLEQDSSLNF